MRRTHLERQIDIKKVLLTVSVIAVEIVVSTCSPATERKIKIGIESPYNCAYYFNVADDSLITTNIQKKYRYNAAGELQLDSAIIYDRSIISKVVAAKIDSIVAIIVELKPRVSTAWIHDAYVVTLKINGKLIVRSGGDRNMTKIILLIRPFLNVDKFECNDFFTPDLFDNPEYRKLIDSYLMIRRKVQTCLFLNNKSI